MLLVMAQCLAGDWLLAANPGGASLSLPGDLWGPYLAGSPVSPWDYLADVAASFADLVALDGVVPPASWDSSSALDWGWVLADLAAQAG